MTRWIPLKRCKKWQRILFETNFIYQLFTKVDNNDNDIVFCTIFRTRKTNCWKNKGNKTLQSRIESPDQSICPRENWGKNILNGERAIFRNDSYHNRIVITLSIVAVRGGWVTTSKNAWEMMSKKLPSSTNLKRRGITNSVTSNCCVGRRLQVTIVAEDDAGFVDSLCKNTRY
jgi:hypothetical protein